MLKLFHSLQITLIDTDRFSCWWVRSQRLALLEGQRYLGASRDKFYPAGQPHVRRTIFFCDTLAKRGPSKSKAVADGAVSYYLDHFVEARMSKVTYGTEVSVLYNPEIHEHLARSSSTFTYPDGTRCLPGAFSEILQKVASKIAEFILLNERPSHHVEYSGLPGR